METSGQLLTKKRKSKKISLNKAAGDLLIKKDQLEALEEGDWQQLPEPAFVKGFIKNYSIYLGLDAEYVLALYRREFDERKFPQKDSPIKNQRRLMLTPNKFISFVFVVAIIVFIVYLTSQYFSILSAPKLEVSAPPDDFSTSIPYVVISGKVEKESTVAINGEFVPVDADGNFSKQAALEEGRNAIEIVAAKRLSPKSRATKVVRLTK